MKKILILAAAIFLFFGLKTEARDLNFNGGYGYFYSSLAPYGNWIELESGVLVWHPRGVRVGWAPYRYGQWAWTNDGWYWDSYEPFGYIVYHYGRWYYDDYYGWIWVPDDVWAPAWVEWRYDNDYIGWAPLPPYASFSVNLGLHFSLNFITPYRHWHFIKYRYICEPYVYRHFVGSQHVHGIFIKTKYKTDYGYKGGRVINRGVDVSYIRNMGGVKIRERNINKVDNPRDLSPGKVGRDGDVRTYIPSRDELSRNGVRDMKVIRAERRSSLDVERMNIGRSRDVSPREGEAIRERDTRKEEIRKNEAPEVRQRPEIRNEVRRENPVVKPRENVKRQEPVRRDKVDTKRQNKEPERGVRKERKENNDKPARKVERKNEPKRDPRQSRR